jgi:arginine transport system substrate-binding protein
MSAFFKRFFIAIIAVAVIIGLIVLKPFQTNEKPWHETLVVGLQSGYPPFEYMDAKGKIVGFDLDISEQISEKLGKKLVIKDMEFDGLILSLKQGKIDLILSGMNITPSRLKEILLVPYHGEAATSLSLIFWNEIPEGIHSIEAIATLPNPIVSVQAGSVSENYMSKFPQIQLKSFDGALAPLMDVKYGKSTANLVETPVAEYLKTKHPEINILTIPLSSDEAILGFGIGVNKENQELYQEIQQAIQELKASGKLKLLEEKWFKGDE